MKRMITLAAVAVSALALALGVGAAPAALAAAAHGGDGVLEVEAAHPTTTGVHFIVRLTYQNDGDAVSGAEVTATAISPAGEELAPVTLSPAAAGSYQGPVEMPDPGDWTVRFSSPEPAATLEQTVEISATTTTPTTGADGGSDGFAPADDGTGDSAAADDESDSDDGSDSDSDGVPILLVVAAAVVAIGGVFTALRIVRRTRGPAGPAPIDPGDGETSGEGTTPTDSATSGPGPTGGTEGS